MLFEHSEWKICISIFKSNSTCLQQDEALHQRWFWCCLVTPKRPAVLYIKQLLLCEWLTMNYARNLHGHFAQNHPINGYIISTYSIDKTLSGFTITTLLDCTEKLYVGRSQHHPDCHKQQGFKMASTAIVNA